MNIDDLTIGQAKEIAGMLDKSAEVGLSTMIGKKCIVRTYRAGVWYGKVSEKSGSEVVLTDARRMWRWWAAKSISLSAVAAHGITAEKSRIAPAVDSVWLEAIELIPAGQAAINSIEGAPDAEAK